MSGEADKATGRLKKAAGELTDDDEMKREGKLDELSGKAKDSVDK
ncbi:CsbD family protein, partial [Klebsiella michiganensis]